ncbi:FRG domain-containing protein [Bacillus cereus]|uniref:FRG domain-containing protein n=1 Tax=Bacillus cereus TaxID=1396 RepID=UPI00210A85F5|nr:FRG domain-containing protein [Bacillus cereus]
MKKIERYSKREEEGLHTPEEIIIDRLSEYIDLFSNGTFANYLFRGEPTNYIETVSSALRDVPPPGYIPERGIKNEKSILNTQNEFKREVWYKLTPDERTYFSAFSQHHGIPTNLIDITTSPLVSLYFACQEYTNPKITNGLQFDEERGFVYLFKDDFVNITNILTKFEGSNILELFASDEKDIFLDMYYAFLNFETEHPEVFYEYLKKLHIDFYKYFEDFISDFMANLDDFPSYDDGMYKLSFYKYSLNILNVHPRYEKFYEKITNMSETVFLYTACLQLYLGLLLFDNSASGWLEVIPKFKYAPILTFERGRNQQGLFVYQNYLQSSSLVSTPYIVSIQRIWPDKIIVINNKNQILKELDFIGINEKFIYGDYDNIAKYIKRKSY